MSDESAPLRLSFATFAGGARDNRPKMRDLDWFDFARKITRFPPPQSADKLSGPLWSPTIYREGATRGNAGIVSMTAMVLDVDDGTPPEVVLRLWAGSCAVWHVSYSHTPGAPRYRVILPFAEPVPVALWPRVWQWAQVRSQGHLDPQTKDPARIYLLPIVPPTMHPAQYRAGAVDFEAPPLQVLERDLPALPAPPAPVRPPPVQVRHGVSDGALRRIRNERLKTDPEARRAAALAVGGVLAGEGAQECARRVVCPQCGDASVWWPIAPRGSPKALCHHRNSCGFSAWLDALLDGVTA
jgi:hypothetical protein